MHERSGHVSTRAAMQEFDGILTRRTEEHTEKTCRSRACYGMQLACLCLMEETSASGDARSRPF